MNLDECDRLMQKRDHLAVVVGSDFDRDRVRTALADMVPGLVGEVRRLLLQLGEKSRALKQCEDENSRFMKKIARLTLALEEIAAIPPTGDGHLMKAQNIADEMVHLNKTETWSCDKPYKTKAGDEVYCWRPIGHDGVCS